jgi:hypothetical protein
MLKIALLATVAFVAVANPATAGWYNGLNPNGLNPNSLTVNGLSNNGIGATAVVAHSPPSDFCVQGKSEAVIAHSPPSDFCAQPAQPAGLSLGGVDGMKVMSVELPN